MRESGAGYVPGSVVWVPLSMAQSHPKEAAPRRRWLQRFFRRKEPSLYHRCLAMHIGTASKNKSAALS